MRPPYDLNTQILRLITAISEQIGAIKATFLEKPTLQLRKLNKIRTIHSSLAIEGNTLSLDQVTAIIENKHVLGPRKDILEVENAIQVYDRLNTFNPFSQKDLLRAHKLMMNQLVNHPGVYRSKNVGVIEGQRIRHLAPPAGRIPGLMDQLFDYLENVDELMLIKSCVFHYELEFIHPFLDGNGRLGRLWQSVILMSQYPVFEFLPFESIVRDHQADYYKVLAESDRSGKSTVFIEFMLRSIHKAMAILINESQKRLTQQERIEHFAGLGISPFTRKDYMKIFKTISAPTASRDLKAGVDSGFFIKDGDKNKTTYVVNT